MRARTTGTYALIALAAVLTAVVCLSRGAVAEAVYPAERAWRAVADGVWPRVAGVFRGASAAAENVRLRRRVEELSLVEERAVRLEEENIRLRALLDYRPPFRGSWLAAEVIARDGGAMALRHTLRTDKGSLAGVKPGAVVVVKDGLVGRVESVTPHTSEIRLVSDPSLKVGCEATLPDGRTFLGTLSGGTDECLSLRHILSPVDLPPDAVCPVRTSGLGGVFPPGIAVGVLRRILKEPDSPRREGEVRPSVEFATLKDVFICRER